jgi:hypothetical protein
MQCSNFKNHTILNETAGKFDILLIQEPWIGEIRNGNRGPPAHKAWQPIIPIQTIRKGDRPRILTYARHNRSDIKITMRSDIAIDPDFQILEVTQKPHPPIFIINLYNGKDTNNIYTIDRLKQIPVPQQQMAIYTGDWNIHHTNWSLDGSTRGQATQHKNWLDENNLTLINTPDVPTWQSNSGQQSILDLTFTNAPASNNSIIKDWQVNHELSFASDHFPITWTIDQGQKPTSTPTYNTRFNLKETKTKKWTEAYLDEIDKHQIAFNNLNNTNLTQSQAEQAAIAIQEALIEATRKTARIARPSEKAKPWWNAEIQHALKNT